MERLQPVDQGAEESTLGAMMLSTEACGTAVELLKPEDFWLEQHRTIFAAISHLYDNGKPTDSFSVASFLKAKGLLEAVGERAYVYTITDSCPTPHNVTHYAGIVRDHSVRRKLIEAGNKVMNLGYSTQDELEKQLDSAETEVYSVGERLRRASLCHVSKAIDLSLERMYEARERGSRVTGLRTGFNELDSYLAGLQPSNLIVIGGRTSMGKTSLALNIAQHVALHEDTGVLLFSMEMSKKELGDRLIQSQAHVDSSDFRAGRLSDIQVNSVEEAGERISKAKIYIDDEGDRSLAEIRSISRRAVAKGKVGLLVVDYIQLLYGDGRTENRAQEMSKIARSLKVMAMQLGVPVIAVSQLRRPPPGAARKEPTLEDLKETSSIEQAADVVLLLYRPEVDNPRNLELRGVAHVQVAKHRNGPTGLVQLVWVPSYSSFYDPENEQEVMV